ncbi:zinc finger BED domain-containing protein 4-like [Andrena cerasifolii]|uniref:zinc finger BED domain-containing protein 4-like n=1 Tax=Andrena cerasifolii TaxID=2819439 RepID=UPI004037DCAC
MYHCALEASSPRAKQITDAIARMVILDCQLFSMVSDEGFKQLMNVLEPRYEIPGRATFADDIVLQLYETERQKLQDMIKEVAKTTRTFAFTTDGCMSRSKERFISLTVHYLNADFVLNNCTLQIECVTEAHTSENLNARLRKCLTDWDLFRKEFTIFFITDNAANIAKAVKLCNEWERIPCYAHTLQLVVKEAIKKSADILEILKNCKAIVTFFHRSTVAYDKLNAVQKQHNPTLQPLTLIGDVETRWNSQYDMLCRLLQVQHALNAVLCQRGMPDIITSSE